MPVKKATSTKKQETKKSVIAKAVKQSSQDKNPTKIPESPIAPRNDKNKGGLSIPVYNLVGKESGNMDLPKEFFGEKVNKKLLAQAMRIYSTNQKFLPGSTKTRGEVNMTTQKWFRQKGTGRARHGAQSAPIFVGGGIAFGPKPRKVRLELPKKMKKAALISALSARALDSGIVGLTGLDKATGKTKEMADLMNQVSSIKYQGNQKKPKNMSILILTGGNNIVSKAVRNLPKIHALSVSNLNVYEVIRHQVLAVTQDALDQLGDASTSLSKYEVLRQSKYSLSKQSASKGEK